MGRKASPYVWRDWFVTEAGGQGIHKLCPITDGIDKAKDELERWLGQLREKKKAEEASGLVQTDSPYTVAQIAAEFLEHKKVTRPKSFDFYHRSLQRLVEWYGDLELSRLRLAHGTQYMARLQGLNLKNATVNRHVVSAKGALGFAVDNDLLLKNPWKKLPKLPERARERTVTDEEFKKLLDACNGCIAFKGRLITSREENVQLMKDILCILRFTALRPGELRNLRWHHIQWDSGLIVIPAAEQKTGTTAKNPQERIAPMLVEGRDILLRRKEKYGHQPLVFPNVNGVVWKDSDFSRRFIKLRERAGLDTPDHNGEKLVWYSLRHTRLTEAGIAEKWSYPVLQRFGGHAPGSKVTARYIHPDRDDVSREAEEGRKRRQEA
jgi:integrase